MKFKINGREVAMPESIRVGEACEAERELGIDFDRAGGAGKMALMLYIALRRAEPTAPAVALAREVQAADVSDLLDVEDDAVPPADGPVSDSADGATDSYGPDPDSPLTTGPQLSAPSA